MGGFLLVDKLDKGIGKAKLSVCIASLGGNTGGTDEGIIGTENQCICIQKKDFFRHAAKVRHTKIKNPGRSGWVCPG